MLCAYVDIVSRDRGQNDEWEREIDPKDNSKLITTQVNAYG